MGNIIAELARIQRELKAPKNLYNKFGNYYYRNAEGILEAVKPLLGGLALIINDEPVAIGDRYYIKATATLTDGDGSISSVAYAREDETKKGMDGCQITGACSSYARKYALNALLMIDDSKDSDDPQLSQAADPDERPKAQKAQVETQTAVPAPKKAMSEGAKLLVAAKAKLEKEIPGFDFGKARAELVANGEIENIPSATITLDQAAALISKMRDKYGKKAG